jgi:rod shape-determining protein MreD
MSKEIVKYILLLVALLGFQVLVLNNIRLGGYINPYIYVLFIMLLPYEVPGWLLLALGFGTGLLMDAFLSTLGLHSSATLFMAFVRPAIISLLTTRDDLDKSARPSMSVNGLQWFVGYTFLMVLAHHLVLFYLEAFTLHHFFPTLLRVILSTFTTSVFVILSQYFVYRR